MAFQITDNTKSIMADIGEGKAFDRSVETNIGGLNTEIAGLKDNNYFGEFSPITSNVSGLVDDTPMTAYEVGGLRDENGNPFSLEDQAALVGKPKGITSALQSHVSGQLDGLVDNISLYASHQSVATAMGDSQGCGALSEHFGSLMSPQTIQDISRASNAITDFKQLKTQLQSEIDSFDENAIGILTGKINNTILARAVKGTGLFDQVDGMLIQSGIAKDSAQAQAIRDEIGERLTPNINNFYNKKAGVNAEVEKISKARGGILGMITKEAGALNKATTTLRKLGAANSMQGLFKTNECVQTLMGFVGSASFVSKLGF